MAFSSDNKSGDSVGIQITSVKQKGPNYLLWSKVMRVYIETNGKLKHLVKDPPSQESKSFEEWPQDDFMITTWYQSLIWWEVMHSNLITVILFPQFIKLTCKP